MPAGDKSPDGRSDGRQARWQQHNQERRQQILDAAIAVVEDGAPGAEFHVHQIAKRAGLNRSVVYRHFTDRADLDSAIQAEILRGLIETLLPEVTLDGTVNEIIRRVVSAYVGWAVAHPALHRLAEQESAPGAGELDNGIQQIAGVIADLLETARQLLGVDLDEAEQAFLDPLAHSLVGMVFGAVRRWAARDSLQPPAPYLAVLLSDAVWHIIDGHSGRLGLSLDPDVPVEQLLGTAGLAAEPTP